MKTNSPINYVPAILALLVAVAVYSALRPVGQGLAAGVAGWPAIMGLAAMLNTMLTDRFSWRRMAAMGSGCYALILGLILALNLTN